MPVSSSSTEFPLAPIALFVFKRPEHTARTLEALAANPEAKHTDLIVFADDARHEGELASVAAVRALFARDWGFRTVELNCAEGNKGLARSIIGGVTQVCQRFGQVIVVEDDLVTAPCFLRYMNDSLNIYREDAEVISISAYSFPTTVALPNTFFLRGAECWGWATWARAWAAFEPDSRKLLQEIKRRNLVREFDYHGAFRYTRMLRLQAAGKIDSWAIRWHAQAFLAGKLTLYPGQSLVRNIGMDGSGTHEDDTTAFNSESFPQHLPVSRVPIERSEQGSHAFRQFGLRTRISVPAKLLQLTKRFLRKFFA